MNNYEKIKNMGIEEMARFLQLERCKICQVTILMGADDCPDYLDCLLHAEDFLQQEAQ